MWLVAEEEKPLASLKFVGLATSGEGDLPVETINRDRALNLVIGHLVVFAEHHPDGLEHCFFNKRECLGRGERRSLGSEITGMPGYACCGGWVIAMITFLGALLVGITVILDSFRRHTCFTFRTCRASRTFVTSTVESSKPTSE